MKPFLFTHQPTWDDCQQLLQVLFTTEERERIIQEAWKLIPGPTGVPTTIPAAIDAAFPMSWPEWDYNTAEDLLITADDQDTCRQGTKDLLKTLGDLGYRASAKKAQICKPQVSYLGYLLKDGQR